VRVRHFLAAVFLRACDDLLLRLASEIQIAVTLSYGTNAQSARVKRTAPQRRGIPVAACRVAAFNMAWYT